ncbi:hypothetical protein Nepgr_011779 [Nepenthes gracilis]|uniref:Cytochrome P450 n=1 Tax=Nepenthes gracilis TaxID=150966 RepID=A0AAD3SEX7_NEPGR|nr:hypothetical protein Nepgr_011779 [Nepenthes gracilis]
MKLQPSFSSYDHSFHICFSFAAIFSLTTVAVAIYLLKLKRRWCNCKICHGYLTSSWTEEFQNLCDWYAYLLQKSPTKTIHIHILNNVITANPENVEYMLKTKFDNYPKGKQFSVILGDLLGLGIFNVDGELWRFQRKMASLVLDSLSVRSYTFEVVAEEINRRLVPLLSSVAGKVDCVLDLQARAYLA